jgi:hypothetical protein
LHVGLTVSPSATRSAQVGRRYWRALFPCTQRDISHRRSDVDGAICRANRTCVRICMRGLHTNMRGLHTKRSPINNPRGGATTTRRRTTTASETTGPLPRSRVKTRTTAHVTRWFEELHVPKATLIFTAVVALSAGAWSIFTYIHPRSSPPIPANVTAKEAPANPSPPASRCGSVMKNFAMCVRASSRSKV